ncbi:MAG: thiamine pyrophosphate-dependent dehydrogenase E1 component subunit alpha [Spirochaetia bacterium]
MPKVIIPKEKLTEMYYRMALTRAFEETAARLFTLGKVHGTAHFCIGEEATGIGVCEALEPEDLIYATHRGHGQSIGKGMDVNRMMAEFMGKETGVCRGRGGCMHIADVSAGNLGANGIVGGGIPIAVGAALSVSMRKEDRVVVCFFGDGAANQGTFHESLNLASIWKLPIIFACVNNGYGMSMSVGRHMNIADIAARASSYGIPGKSVGGNDIFEIFRETGEARKIARSTGPILLVLNTYRILGHSKSDAGLYRRKEEVEEWKRKDPIKRMRRELLADRCFSETELADLEEKAEKAVSDALAFAEASPEPGVENVEQDVYA